MKKPECICASAPPGVRRHLKKMARRARRRMRGDLGGRLREVVRGWSD